MVLVAVDQFPHCSVNSFRFLGFLLWFVLGPGDLREAPGGPGKAHGYPHTCKLDISSIRASCGKLRHV